MASHFSRSSPVATPRQREAGEAIVRYSKIRKIGFTGAPPTVRKILQDRCRRNRAFGDEA